MRSLCGPQARLRSEQPVAGNEITARLKFARLGGKKARSAVPPPGATSVRPSATCAQQSAQIRAKNGRAARRELSGPFQAALR